MLSDTSGAKRGEATATWLVALAATLSLLASLPALPTRGLLMDDWVVYSVLWREGFGAVAQLMRDVAHTGYVIPLAPFLTIGQETPNLAARVIALAAHLLNGVLLFAALRRSDWTAPVAGLAAALFLVSPFYAARLTLNGLYDVLLVFWLASVLLMTSRQRPLRLLGPLALLVSLSLETLAALEPLRLLIAWRRGERLKTLALRLAPYWGVVALVFALRLTLLGKQGHYAGQYAMLSDLGRKLEALENHLASFPEALAFSFGTAFGLMPGWLWLPLALLVVGLALLAAARLGPRLGLPWLLRPGRRLQVAPPVALAGLAVTLAGAVPYALAGVHAWPTRIESRHAFASQVGVLMLLAVLILCLPSRRLRAAAAVLAVLAGGASSLHDSKWLLYDAAVLGDLHRQLAAALAADPAPKLVELTLEPPSTSVFFRHHCLGAQDLNVALDVLRGPGTLDSFVYEPNCGDLTNPSLVPADNCPLDYLTFATCPERRVSWTYRLDPNLAGVSQVGLPALVGQALDSAAPPRRFGVLTTDAPASTAAAARGDLPPLDCDRRPVAAVRWLLDLPETACRN